MKKTKVLTYSTSQRGQVNVNLNEKKLNFIHLDFDREEGTIPFSISHIYQNSGIDKGYGTGFSLNFEQTLKKMEETSKYKLTLADGSEEIFEEVYYYKDSNDKRVYKTTSGQSLKRSDITLSLDGTLKYNNHLIYVDLKTDTGLTLKSDYKDFIGSDKIELRYEDLASLEEEIKQIEEAIEDLEHNKNEYRRFQNVKYTLMLNSQKDLEDASTALSEMEVAQFYDSLEGNNNYYAKKEEYLNLTKKEKISTYGVASRKTTEDGKEVISYIPAFGVIKYMPQNEYSRLAIENKQYDYLFEKIQDDKSRFELLTKSAKRGEYYEQLYTYELEQLNEQLEALNKILEDKSRENQLALYHLKQQYNEKNTIYQNSKKAYEDEYNKILKDYYEKLLTRANLQIESYENLKSSKEYQRDELLKQIPELYLSNDDGIIYGYNTYGKLCMIMDAYEHQAIIEYNDNNQIKDILDSDNHKIEFIYNGDNQLIRIVDDLDNYMDYSYENKYLKQIQYQNGDVFSFTYLNGKLTEICDIDSVGYQLVYQDNFLTKLKYMSFATQNVDEEIGFVSLENQITVTNSKNELRTVYLFDNNQSLTTEYVIKEEVLEAISTHEYESSHCSFSMSTNKNYDKVLNISDISFNGIKKYSCAPLNSYSSNYILYAFVEADSYDSIRTRRITAYCSHIENETNIFFELRCCLKYNGYIKEYCASFNPFVKGKQFIALPVSLDEDSEGNSIIPNEIAVYVDYSGNRGMCKIYNLGLAQGEYTYCEFNETHHKIYESYSETSSIQTEFLEKKGIIIQKKEINYSYNPKEWIEKSSLKTKTFEYNIDEMLVNKEENTLDTFYRYNKQGKLLKEQDSNGKVSEYIYNTQGACIQKKTYHSSMPNEAYIEEKEVNESGIPTTESNELGFKNQYNYLNNTLVSITTPNGNVLYMHSSDNANSISTEVKGENNYNTSVYDKGRLTEYHTEGMKYQYTYDEFGREKELYINEELYCKFSIQRIENQYHYTTIFNNRSGYKKITDLYDKTLSIEKIINNNTVPYISYEYDNRDRIVKEYHYLEDKEEILEYIYVEDTLVGIKTKDYTKVFNQALYSQEVVYQMNDTSYSNQCSYDKNGKVKEYSYNVNHSAILNETYTYDNLDRLKEISNPLIKNKYTYLSKNGRTTSLISSLQKRIKDKHQRFNYEYDKEGNIIYKLENHSSTKYTYDKLNRLVREDNEELNQTILYTYDSNGNIQSKELYTYTLTDNLENKEIIEYNYSDFNDYLTQFNGREIKYNSLGNPILYKDIPLVWEQKELRKYGDIEFKYGVNHIRTYKKTLDTEIEYILDGTRILKEKRKHYTTHLESIIDEDSTIDTYEEEIEYIYSNQGIIGFDHIRNGKRKRYYYNKNILGDILEIYDEESKLVGKYSYDTYGNHKVINYTVNNIGDINPIRYRGYYFDTEINLYYLNSRYYDSETSRFISVDSIEYINPDTINGLNLYAYCNNNPIMNVDPSGMAWWNPFTWFDGLGIVGKIILGAVLFVGAVALTAFTGGALAPMFVTMGVGLASGTLIGGFSAVISSGGDWSQFGNGALDGFADGMLWGGIFAFAGASIGAIKYAANSKGAVEGTKRLTQITKGQKFDRYGSLKGKYMTDMGTPASKLALPASNTGAKTTLQATKNFKAYTGIVADAFGGTGGGVQYVMRYSIEKLIKMGWLAIV